MTTNVRRREFITALGTSAAAWPLAAHAQQASMPVVGMLSNTPPEEYQDRYRLLLQGLGETGFVVDRNVAIDYQWTIENDRRPAMVADLVRRQVNVLIVIGLPGARAAKAATRTIPILFSGGFDPVAAGVVESLSRPGGNVSGVTSLGVELGPKRLELLHELLPAATSIALLVNPTNPTSETQLKDVQAAARLLGRQLHILQASNPGDFDDIFATIGRLRIGGLVISNDGLLVTRAAQLATLALRQMVPAIFEFHPFAVAGGLMSYGGTEDSSRVVGAYAGRILKGEKPADLPVQQATRIQLIINMKTAKALGLTFPITLLGRADEVIE